MGRCTVNGPIPDCQFDGRVHEVITYNGQLTGAERNATVEYLKVKWGL
jgi:hypothetical protein